MKEGRNLILLSLIFLFFSFSLVSAEIPIIRLGEPSTIYHNLLSGLQGGIAGEFYHLTSAVYNWVTNNLNNFWTKNETIVANLSGSYGYSELDPTLIKDENGAYVG